MCQESPKIAGLLYRHKGTNAVSATKRQRLPIIMILFIAVFLSELAYQMIIPILLPLLRQQPSYFHLCKLTDGTLMNTYSLVMITYTLIETACGPIFGACSDYFSRKRVLQILLICMFIGYLLTGYAFVQKSILVLLLGRLLSGMAAATTPVAQAAMSDYYFSLARSKQFGWLGVALTMPMVMAPFVTGMVVGNNTQTWRLLLPLVIALLCATLVFILVTLIYPGVNHDPGHNAYHDVVFSENKQKKISYTTLRYFILFFVLESVWSYVFQYYNLFAVIHLGFSGQGEGLLLFYIGVSIVLGLVLGYPLCRKIASDDTIIHISLIGMFLLICFYAWSFKAIVLWVTLPLMSLFVAIGYVAIIGQCSFISSKHQGLMLGFNLSLMAGAWTLGGFWVRMMHLQGLGMQIVAGALLISWVLDALLSRFSLI